MVSSTTTSPSLPPGSSQREILGGAKLMAKPGLTSSPSAGPSRTEPSRDPASTVSDGFGLSSWFERLRNFEASFFPSGAGRDNAKGDCSAGEDALFGQVRTTATGVAVPPWPRARNTGLTKIGATRQNKAIKKMP